MAFTSRSTIFCRRSQDIGPGVGCPRHAHGELRSVGHGILPHRVIAGTIAPACRLNLTQSTHAPSARWAFTNSQQASVNSLSVKASAPPSSMYSKCQPECLVTAADLWRKSRHAVGHAAPTRPDHLVRFRPQPVQGIFYGLRLGHRADAANHRQTNCQKQSLDLAMIEPIADISRLIIHIPPVIPTSDAHGVNRSASLPRISLRERPGLSRGSLRGGRDRRGAGRC